MKFNLLAVLPAVLATAHVTKSLAKPYEHLYQDSTPLSQPLNDGYKLNSPTLLEESAQSLSDSWGTGDSSGAGDSWGAGDSSGTNFDPYPIDSSSSAKGVLFLERETAGHNIELHTICIKANKQFSVGQATDTTKWSIGKDYIVHGLYKKKAGILKLKLILNNSTPIERVTLKRIDDPDYEFSGIWKVKNNISHLKAFYLSEQAYYSYSCDLTLGH